jgi:glutamate synthase (NADPH), homotetrameric
MSNEKVKMPEQDPLVRNANFLEVSMGYTYKMAQEEAARCLQCKAQPCVSGCPVNVKIPEFIKCITEGDMAAAYDKISETNGLPAVCGRVCPQESQCESKCVRAKKGEAVGIGRLERFTADWYRENNDTLPEKPESNGIKVAVLGAGPAGLTCARDMALLGYEVTVFEAFHEAGGVLIYGIPEFRLPKAIVKKEIEKLKALGVKIELDMVIGRVLTIDELFEDGFESVFIGTGAGLPVFMGLEGENAIGVYSANEYLTRSNLMKAYNKDYHTPIRKSKSVAVVGGGNVAMDACRTAKRLGAEKVYIVYRRSEAEMPARLEEIHHAKEEQIEFLNLHNPVRILVGENNEVIGMELQEMELGEPGADGRRRAIPVDRFKTIDVDTVIISIGTSPNPLIKSTTENLETNNKGCISVDEDSMETTREGVFAGGDAVTGAATVILAMGAGKKAAANMHKYICKKHGIEA